MTDNFQDYSAYNVLNPPDLSELMSQIISSGKDGERLVFVEYEPATRAFYDHLGLPDQAKEPVKKKIQLALEKASNCEEFLKNLIFVGEKTDVSGDNSELKTTLKELRKKFPKKLAEIAKWLFSHEYGRECEIILHQDVAEMEAGGNKRVRFLLCLARASDKNEADFNWLKSFLITNRKKIDKCEELYHLLHWLFQRTPQIWGKGGCSAFASYVWQLVDNSQKEIMEFPAVAGLEILFGMRISKQNNTLASKYHTRINIFLDTGEYAGQMIVFNEKILDNSENLSLFEKAVQAARLVRRILPAIRYARYTNAILQGQTSGIPDHVVVRYLPYLLPLEKFYVRVFDDQHNHDDKSDAKNNIKWESFWDDKSTIFIHECNQNRGDDPEVLFNHFEPRIFKLDPKKIPILNSKNIKKNLDVGFIDYEYEEGVLLGFSTNGFANRIAVLALVDEKLLPRALFSMKGLDANQKKDLEKHGIITLFPASVHTDYYDYYDISEEFPGEKKYILKEMLLHKISDTFSKELRRNFSTCITTNLSIILEPRHPLGARRIEAEKEGKSYREQYGTAIYGQGYLNLRDIDRFTNKDQIFVLKYIRHTQRQLVDTLFEPRGYRAIARVIFEDFFCPLWKYLDFHGDPEEDDRARADHYTSLGSLVREALDFEDTLRLEGGYREHFVHSYHVFLLGFYLIEQLELTQEFTMDHLKGWFMVSMYHDVGYPIQKMEEITKKYLDRLDTSTEAKVGDEMGIEVNIGFGKLLASDLFGSRLRTITDTLVDKLFPVDPEEEIALPDDSARQKEIRELIKYLELEYKTKIEGQAYKEGIKHAFYQYCLKLALNDGEHGILSSLLFDRAARATSFEDLEMRKAVSVAILGHHIFDNDGKWQLTDRWTLGRLKQKIDTALSHEDLKERLCSTFWDPAFFAYELRMPSADSTDAEDNHKSRNICRFLGTLLILCDTVSQWGRTDNENDEKLALLRNRENSDPLVMLCYPTMRNTRKARNLLNHYESQLMYLAGSNKENPVEFVELYYNCPSYQKTPDNKKSAVRCSECKEKPVPVKGKLGSIQLNSKIRTFASVLQMHKDIEELAREKKKTQRLNC